MSNEAEKSKIEILFLENFLSVSKKEYEPDSIEKLDPNLREPDLRCKIKNEGYVDYELVEICDSQMAKKSSGKGYSEEAFYTADPSKEIVAKKLKKQYKSNFPIELVCYNNALLVTPDDVIVPTLRCMTSHYGGGCFRMIWYFGDQGVYEIYRTPQFFPIHK